MLKHLLLPLAIALSLPAQTLDQARESYLRLPLQFEANGGQVDASVPFIARGVNYNLFVTNAGGTIVQSRNHAAVKMQIVGGSESAKPHGVEVLPGKVNYLHGTDEGAWHRNIATYSKVRMDRVYPGIDLVYYGNQGSLEFDFIVAPGADLGRIHLRIEGSKPALNKSGDLTIGTGDGQLSFGKPVVYQNTASGKAMVAGSFIVHKQDVTFQAGTYDRTQPLVIDPVLSYATFIGGRQENLLQGMAVNARGETYVTGSTLAIDYPVTSGVVQAKQPTCAPGDCSAVSGPDAFVSKLSADGTRLIYSTYLGGNNEDQGRAVTVDANDNAYVTGYTYSNDFPITGDAIQKLCSPVGVFSFATNTFVGLQHGCEQHPAGEANVYSANTPDVFISKLNPTGTALLYSTFFGGSGNDNPTHIALDEQNNILIAGSTSSVTKELLPTGGMVPYPETTSAFQSDVSNFYGFVPFLTKLSADGHTVLYSSIIGGPVAGGVGSVGTSMAVGKNGIVYLGGFTGSPSFPVTTGALRGTCTPSQSGLCYQAGFLSAFDTTKSGAQSVVFSTYIDGKTPAQSMSGVAALAVDAQNNVYATGATTAQDFPTTAGTVQPACANSANRCQDAFVLSLDPAGAMRWSTLYGSASGCCAVTGAAIALDPDNNVYIVGGNGGAYDLVQKNAFQPGEVGHNAFLLALGNNGSQILFGSYFGGTCEEVPTGIALDSTRNIYISGYTCSTDLPVTKGSLQTVDPGYRQGFVAKVSALAPATSTTLVVNQVSTSAGLQVTLTANVAGQAPTGQVDFFNGNVLLGSAAVDPDGSASRTDLSFTAGSYSLTAVYRGDANNPASTSAVQVVVVTSAGVPTLPLSNLNSANLSASVPIAANSIVAAFGAGLSTVTASATSLPLPTSIGGVRVNVQDAARVVRQAPLFYVSPTQINYAVPDGTAPGMATITVTGNQNTYSTQQQILAVAPGVYGYKGLAVGSAITVANGTQSAVSLVQQDATGNIVSVPLPVGNANQVVVLVLYGTGIRNHAASVTATIGSVTVPVDYAGPQGLFIGEDQINITMPASLRGAGVVNVVLHVDGQASNPVSVILQ